MTPDDPSSQESSLAAKLAPKKDHFAKNLQGDLARLWDRILEAQADLYADAELDFLIANGALSENRPILDIGCGSGAWTRKLLERFPKTTVVATDGDEELLRTFRDRLAPEALKRVAIQKWKIGSSPAPSDVGNCGFAVLRYVLQHQRRPEVFLKEISTALTPGTRIAIIEDDDPLFAMDPSMPEFVENFRVQKEWAKAFNSVDDMGRGVRKAAENAGLEVLKVRFLGQSSLEKGIAPFCEFYCSALDMIALSTPDVLDEERNSMLQKNLRNVPKKYPGAVIMHPQIVTLVRT